MLLSGFSGVEKALAVVDRQTFDNMVNAEISSNINPFLSNFSLEEQAVVSTLKESANSIFLKRGAEQAITVNQIKIALLSQWDVDLSGMGTSQESGVNTEQMLVAIRGALSQAGNTLRIQNGTVTPEQGRTFTNAVVAGQNAAAVAAFQKSTNPNSCSLGSSGNLLDCIGGLFEYFIKTILLQIAGFLAWLAANMFNLAVQSGILDFAKWAPSDALYPIHVVIRQIISLCVVFAGLYLGFMYIIGREETLGRYMAWLIIFALFVNFSYPLSRVFVDVSNVISLNIYASAVGPDALTGNDPNNSGGALILNQLGLQNLIVSATNVKTGTANLIDNINTVPSALLAVAFVLYAAYVLFLLTGVIVFRTGVLIAITIGSPLLFIDSVVPKLGDLAMKLRKIYFEQLISAPVLMIMLALTLKFLEVFQLNKVTTSSVAIFFNILMMLIMLHIMLKVTKEVSGTVGEAATKFMGQAGGFGLGLASGGTGILARQTIGRFAAGVASGEGALGKWVGNNQNSFLGRRALDLSSSLSKSTYDMRNSGTISGVMNRAGMGMGSGSQVTAANSKAEKQKDLFDRYGRIQTKNDDGTVNQEGVAAKRQFATNFGNAMGRKFQEEERGRQEDQKRSLSAYGLEEGKDKQKAFFKEKDEDTRNEMLTKDQEEALAMNKNGTNTNQNITSIQVPTTPNNSPEGEGGASVSWVGRDMTKPAYERKREYEAQQNNNKQEPDIRTMTMEDLAKSLEENTLRIAREEKERQSSQSQPEVVQIITPERKAA